MASKDGMIPEKYDIIMRKIRFKEGISEKIKHVIYSMLDFYPK